MATVKTLNEKATINSIQTHMDSLTVNKLRKTDTYLEWTMAVNAKKKSAQQRKPNTERI